MSTSTTTTTHTRTHTATYLSDVIMGTIGDVLALLGIDTSRFVSEWDQDQSAIAAWINEGSLKEVVLECHRPNGTVKPVFEFPIVYSTGDGAGTGFLNSRAAWARYQAKLENVPAGTTFRLFCSYNGPHSEQMDGPAKRTSTDGLRSSSFGNLAEGPHARADMRYLS